MPRDAGGLDSSASWSGSLSRVMQALGSAGLKHVVAALYERGPTDAERAALAGVGVTQWLRCDGQVAPTPADVLKQGACDALIVCDQAKFGWVMRYVEGLSRAGVVVVPADAGWVCPGVPAELDRMAAIERWVPAEYAARSGLKGHYLEFGVFYGASFFRAWRHLEHWLEGDFYAFDSFAGLSKPHADETSFTGGDFTQGSYACHRKSFEITAELWGVASERMKVVEGWYTDSLRVPAVDRGLTPQSVSVCVIDCDLFEPTRDVLEFVTPLLEPGALLYFDDWRLCRASPQVGERGAAVQWLKNHPHVELVELHRDHWQHQWFIFHGR